MVSFSPPSTRNTMTPVNVGYQIECRSAGRAQNHRMNPSRIPVRGSGRWLDLHSFQTPCSWKGGWVIRVVRRQIRFYQETKGTYPWLHQSPIRSRRLSSGKSENDFRSTRPKSRITTCWSRQSNLSCMVKSIQTYSRSLQTNKGQAESCCF